MWSKILLFFGLCFHCAQAVTTLWGYTKVDGPQKWASLDQAFKVCQSGKEQSPVLLNTCQSVNNSGVVFDYKTIDYFVVDTGVGIELKPERKNGLFFLDQKYHLKRVTFHARSEHSIDEAWFPLEIQLIHQGPQGQILIVAITVKEGKSDNNWGQLLTKIGSAAYPKNRVRIDLNSMLPNDRAFFYYMGSLTTPPCTEGVKWLVMREQITVEKHHIEAITSRYPNNFRPPFPLLERAPIKIP